MTDAHEIGRQPNGTFTKGWQGGPGRGHKGRRGGEPAAPFAWPDDLLDVMRLFRVIDKSGRSVAFEPNPDQAALLLGMHHRNLVLKARQRGFTTACQLYLLAKALTEDDTRCGFVGNDLDVAQATMRTKILHAYDRLPEEARRAVKLVKRSAKELVFSNGSSIECGTALIGGTYRYLHVTEYGPLCARFPGKAGAVKKGAMETCPPDGVIIVESTAEGASGHFYELCCAALDEPQAPEEWRMWFTPWWTAPEYVSDPEGFQPNAELRRYFRDLEPQICTVLRPEQRAWYGRKRAVLGWRDMATQYPSTRWEPFEASSAAIYFWQQMAEVERTEGAICALPYPAGEELYSAWRVKGDTITFWVFRCHPDRVERDYLDYYHKEAGTLADVAEWVRQRKTWWGASFKAGIIAAESEHFADHAARQWGIHFTLISQGDHQTGIERARALLPRCRFDEERTAAGRAALKNYRRAYDGKRSRWSDWPLEDWAARAAEAFTLSAWFSPHGRA